MTLALLSPSLPSLSHLSYWLLFFFYFISLAKLAPRSDDAPCVDKMNGALLSLSFSSLVFSSAHEARTKKYSLTFAYDQFETRRPGPFVKPRPAEPSSIAGCRGFPVLLGSLFNVMIQRRARQNSGVQCRGFACAKSLNQNPLFP